MKPSLHLRIPMGRSGFGTYGYELARELVPLLDATGADARLLRWGRVRSEVRADATDPVARLLHERLGQPAEGLADISLSMFDIPSITVVPGRFRIGYTMWEGSSVPPWVAQALAPFHLVAVPSTWARRALDATLDAALAAGAVAARPGVVVWPGGAPQAALDAPPAASRLRDPAFTFGHIGKFERRKGIAPLVQAYAALALARRDSPMRLLAQWTNAWNADWRRLAGRLLRRHGFLPEAPGPVRPLERFRHREAPHACVDLVSSLLDTQAEVLEVHRAFDAGIYPYFSEGWGLPLIESLACGIACAATPYAAPLEFLRDGAYVPFAETVEAPMAGGFYDETGPWGTWREPTHDAIVDAMAQLLDMEPGDRRRMGGAARSHLAANFTWRAAAARIAGDLSSIVAGLHRAS